MRTTPEREQPTRPPHPTSRRSRLTGHWNRILHIEQIERQSCHIKSIPIGSVPGRNYCRSLRMRIPTFSHTHLKFDKQTINALALFYPYRYNFSVDSKHDGIHLDGCPGFCIGSKGLICTSPVSPVHIQYLLLLLQKMDLRSGIKIGLTFVIDTAWSVRGVLPLQCKRSPNMCISQPCGYSSLFSVRGMMLRKLRAQPHAVASEVFSPSPC